jgi:hypothetical protein
LIESEFVKAINVFKSVQTFTTNWYL